MQLLHSHRTSFSFSLAKTAQSFSSENEQLPWQRWLLMLCFVSVCRATRWPGPCNKLVQASTVRKKVIRKLRNYNTNTRSRTPWPFLYVVAKHGRFVLGSYCKGLNKSPVRRSNFNVNWGFRTVFTKCHQPNHILKVRFKIRLTFVRQRFVKRILYHIL